LRTTGVVPDGFDPGRTFRIEHLPGQHGITRAIRGHDGARQCVILPIRRVVAFNHGHRADRRAIPAGHVEMLQIIIPLPDPGQPEARAGIRRQGQIPAVTAGGGYLGGRGPAAARPVRHHEGAAVVTQPGGGHHALAIDDQMRRSGDIRLDIEQGRRLPHSVDLPGRVHAAEFQITIGIMPEVLAEPQRRGHAIGGDHEFRLRRNPGRGFPLHQRVLRIPPGPIRLGVAGPEPSQNGQEPEAHETTGDKAAG